MELLPPGRDNIHYECIDIDQNRDLAELFQIRSVPTTIIFKDREIRWRQSGIFPAAEIVRLAGEQFDTKE